MTAILLGIVVAGSPLLLGELLTRILGLHDEISRKTIHVLGAVASATLVLFMTQQQIVLLSLIFCVVMLCVRRYKLLKSLYTVSRKSYGEIFFPAGVGLAALVATDARSFACAVLIMGFADTAASLLGTVNVNNSIRFWNKKSLHGSIAFLLVATVLLLGVTDIPVATSILIGAGLTLVEFISPYGSDNVTVAVAAAVVLRLL